MKRKIASTLLIGVIALFSMGFRSQGNGHDFSKGDKISIVKGSVFNSDRDRQWESVTFGLKGFNPDVYMISSLEILTKGGELIGMIDNLTSIGIVKKTYWYSADLEKFKIQKDFSLLVHIVRINSSFIDDISTMANDEKAGTAPIDPEETILIVKYP